MNIKIFKPKAVRRCKKSKIILKKTSISSSSSGNSANSKKSTEIKIFDGECKSTNVDLENISIDEINLDFYMYEQKSDEFDCYNELSDIMKTSKKIKNKNMNVESSQPIKEKHNEEKEEKSEENKEEIKEGETEKQIREKELSDLICLLLYYFL